MKQLRVTNIQRGCVYDGPGVRTTVFLKGCSLHCPWCCNPETISYGEQWFIDEEKCILRHNISSKLCEPCEKLNGTRSIRRCPYGVAEPTSHDISSDELLEILLKDVELYKESRGGVTFSGGEPLLQSEELVPLLDKLKRFSIHIAFETTLVASEKDLDYVQSYVDLYIIDLKLQPQMNLFDSSYLDKIKYKLSLLRDNPKSFRMVFVDEVFDYSDEVLKILRKLGVDNIELLLCHNLGEKKYKKLKINNQHFFAEARKAESFRSYLVKNGIASSMLSI